MALELCSKCRGTGHEGRCEACGGSGFDEQRTVFPGTLRGRSSLPKRMISTPVRLLSPRKSARQKTIDRASPQARTAGVADPGSEKHQALDPPTRDESSPSLPSLEFPKKTSEFSRREVLVQIDAVKSKHPNVTNIKWSNPTCFVATLSDLSVIACVSLGGTTKFSQVKTAGGHLVKKLQASDQITLVSTKPKTKVVLTGGKRPPRTVPHPSQPKVARVKLVSTGEWHRIRGNGPKRNSKPSAVEKQPNKSRTERAPEIPPKNEPTALSMAFEKVARNMDGSKDWGSLRDSNGQFGSYPSFDASEDVDE